MNSLKLISVMGLNYFHNLPIIFLFILLCDSCKEADKQKISISNNYEKTYEKLSKLNGDRVYPICDTIVTQSKLMLTSDYKHIHYVGGKTAFYNEVICQDSFIRNILEESDCKTNILIYIDENGWFRREETFYINEHIITCLGAKGFNVLLNKFEELDKFSPYIQNLKIIAGGYNFLVSVEAIEKYCK